nr:hypothetical protein [Gordonia amicalis]
MQHLPVVLAVLCVAVFGGVVITAIYQRPQRGLVLLAALTRSTA